MQRARHPRKHENVTMIKPVPQLPSPGFVTDGSTPLKERESNMTNNNGGPAYPVPERYKHSGMSKLDEFAKSAMIGILAYSNVSPMHGNWHENCGDNAALASQCYGIARAMLAESQKQATIPRPPT